MELFTVQQIIGCDDETILAAGTVDYVGFSYYMTNAVRADAAATNGEDLGRARGCCTVRCAAASFCFSVFFILQKRRRAL